MHGMDLDAWVQHRVHAYDARIVRWSEGYRVRPVLYELLRFTVKQAWACLFAGLLLGLIICTYLFYPHNAFLQRYDFLFFSAVVIQVLLVYFKLETWEEVRIIALFHIIGTGMEVFKVSVGSWVYPDASVIHISGVPLFTGFMYASVGSYVARCARLFEFKYEHHPPVPALVLLSFAIYINFFSHHYIYDIRYLLFACIFVMFFKTKILFRVWHEYRRMPLILGFMLVALFIWFAENIGTFTSVWIYPYQEGLWHPVSFAKLGSWFLLVIISYTLVYINQINQPRSELTET